DGGSWAPAGSLPALSEGAHSLSYRSVDNVGNVEAARSVSLRVDLTPPQTTLTVGGPVTSIFGIDIVTPQSQLSLSATDNLSGAAATYYSVDGAAEQAYAGPFSLSAGRHSVSFRSVDRAGNAEPAQT